MDVALPARVPDIAAIQVKIARSKQKPQRHFSTRSAGGLRSVPLHMGAKEGQDMSLPRVEVTFNKFVSNPEMVIISQSEAYDVWQLFYPDDGSVSVGTFSNFRYKAFMQAALAAAMRGSQTMGWVKALWLGSIKPKSSLKSFIKTLAKKLAKHAAEEWWRSLKGEVEIYNNVLSTIKWQNRTYFESIKFGTSI